MGLAALSVLVAAAVRSPFWRYLSPPVLLASAALTVAAAVALASAVAWTTRAARIRESTVERSAALLLLAIAAYLPVWFLAFPMDVAAVRPRGIRFPLAVAIAAFVVIPATVRRAAEALFSERAAALAASARKVVMLAGVLAGAGIVGSWAVREEPRPGPRARPDARSLVLIVLDGWSASRSTLPGLGYDRPTTPSLARLAATGTVYARVVTNSLSSPASIKAVLTGVPPAISGSTGDQLLPRTTAAHTLLARAAASGMRIQYVYSHPRLAPRALGLDESGWTVRSAAGCQWVAGLLDFDWLCLGLQSLGHYYPFGTIAGALGAAREMLEESQAEASLLFLHVMAPHDPYRPAAEDRRAVAGPGGAADPYDGYLRTTDRLVGDFVSEVLRRQPEAVVVLLSDHGLRDPRALRGEALRVPVVILDRHASGGVDSTMFGLSDVWRRVIAPRTGLDAPAAPVPLASGALTMVSAEQDQAALMWPDRVCVSNRSLARLRCSPWRSGELGKGEGVFSPSPAERQALVELRGSLRASAAR